MKATGTTVGAIALTLALAASGIALAAGGHDHGAKHGGQFVETEGHQGVELVTKASSVTFHITEGGKPANLNGASLKAIVQTVTGVKAYPLTVEGSMLKTKIAAPLPAGSKIVISGKDGHGHFLQARFVTK